MIDATALPHETASCRFRTRRVPRAAPSALDVTLHLALQDGEPALEGGTIRPSGVFDPYRWSASRSHGQGTAEDTPPRGPSSSKNATRRETRVRRRRANRELSCLTTWSRSRRCLRSPVIAIRIVVAPLHHAMRASAFIASAGGASEP